MSAPLEAPAPRVGAQGASTAGGPTALGTDWHRLHPVTPVLRSWRVLAVLLALYAQQRAQDVAERHGQGLPGQGEALVTLAVLAGAVLLAVAVEGLRWRVTVYAVDAEAVRLHSGLVSRRQRAARLDRLQAVDVVQPLLARLLGFAEVRIEVAGGSGSDIRLAYLREDDARRLRNTLLARAAGLAYEGEDAPEADEHTVVEVPLGRVVGALLLSPASVVLVALVAALVVAGLLTHQAAPVVTAAPLALGLLSALWTGFTSSASWRLAIAADGLRIRHGLLGTRTQTVPPRRVQVVRLSQPLLWRPGGWWRVHANVAGYGRSGRNEDRGSDQHLLLPVATREEAARVLALVLPGLLDQLGPEGLELGLAGSGAGGGWTTSPPRARWLDPLAWRRHGALVTERALLLRSGLLHRRLDVVPHERTQSLALTQGPLQRRLRLAALAVHSTRGPVRPRVRHLDAADAAVLLDGQAARARRARATDGPERWMEAPPVA